MRKTKPQDSGEWTGLVTVWIMEGQTVNNKSQSGQKSLAKYLIRYKEMLQSPEYSYRQHA